MPLATALLEVLHMNLPWVLQPMDLLASMLDPPPYPVVGDALKLLVQMEVWAAATCLLSNVLRWSRSVSGRES